MIGLFFLFLFFPPTEHRYIELFLNSTASGAAEMSGFQVFCSGSVTLYKKVIARYCCIKIKDHKCFTFNTNFFSFLFFNLSGRGSSGYYGNSGGGGSRSSGLRGAYWWCHPTVPIHPGVRVASLQATFKRALLSRKADAKFLILSLSGWNEKSKTHLWP